MRTPLAATCSPVALVEIATAAADVKHEHPVIHGSVGQIAVPIEHCDAQGIHKLTSRHLDYAAWEARRFLKLRSDGIAHGILTPPQRFKYAHLHRWWYPWAYFIQTYVVRLGFLDGAAGFQFAFVKAWYFNTIRLLILELAPDREPNRAPGNLRVDAGDCRQAKGRRQSVELSHSPGRRLQYYHSS